MIPLGSEREDDIEGTVQIAAKLIQQLVGFGVGASPFGLRFNKYETNPSSHDGMGI